MHVYSVNLHVYVAFLYCCFDLVSFEGIPSEKAKNYITQRKLASPQRNFSHIYNAVEFKKMPPKPATAQESPVKKLVELAKTLQFAWFAGHAVTLLSAVLCFLSSRPILYRVAYFGVLESFGIITYQHYFVKPKTPAETGAAAITPASLLQNGDFLYFVMALIWSFTPKFTLSLIPYAMFSLFHVLIYLKSILLPEVFGLNASNSKVVSFIDKYVRDYNERCMYWVGSVELSILVCLLVRVLFWYPRSIILFLSYALFVKFRFENSKYMKSAFAQWRVRLDGIMSHPSIPIPLKQAYNQSKSLLIRISQLRLTKATVAEQPARVSKNE